MGMGLCNGRYFNDDKRKTGCENFSNDKRFVRFRYLPCPNQKVKQRSDKIPKLSRELDPVCGREHDC
jgi:hypothetical protein